MTRIFPIFLALVFLASCVTVDAPPSISEPAADPETGSREPQIIHRTPPVPESDQSVEIPAGDSGVAMPPDSVGEITEDHSGEAADGTVENPSPENTDAAGVPAESAPRRDLPDYFRGPPATAIPGATDRRRIRRFVDGLGFYPTAYTVSDGTPHDEILSIIHRYWSPDPSPDSGSSTAGFWWGMDVVGQTQPATQNFYGRTILTVGFHDALSETPIATRRWTGPWTFSRVSVTDAQLNSLLRLLSESSPEIAASALNDAAETFSRGIRYRITWSAAVPSDQREAFTGLISRIGFAIQSRDTTLEVRSFLTPDLFRRDLQYVFSDSAYTFSVTPVERDVIIVYNVQ